LDPAVAAAALRELATSTESSTCDARRPLGLERNPPFLMSTTRRVSRAFTFDQHFRQYGRVHVVGLE
jgi:hypothetical protein